jgi:hypothetical protein
MSLPWIKIETGLLNKPEVMRLAGLLNLTEHAVVGHLVAFWSWVDANLSRDCPDTTGTKRGLDRVAGVDGFTDAMVHVGWLEFDGEHVSIPNFEYHLSQSAKTRATEARKKQRQRARTGSSGTDVPLPSGQKGGPNKRRGEESNIYASREVHIPDKMNNDQCKAALERWCDYLDEKGWWESSPRQNDIQLEAFWQRAARMGADGFCEAVELAIASGWKNLQPARGASSKRKPESQDAWTRVNAICLEHRADAAERERLLGDDFETFRACGGFSRWSAGNTFERAAMAADFLALKGAAK